MLSPIGTVVAAALCATAAPSQHTSPLFEEEIDGLMHVLCLGAGSDGALGGGSCRSTAEVLAAAGHCHRFYYRDDGPWVRKALNVLFEHRQPAGGYADGPGDDVAMTTRWVLEALSVMDPRAFAEDIRAGEAFLRRQHQPIESPLRADVRKLVATSRQAEDPIAALRKAEAPVLTKMAQGFPFGPDGKPDLAGATSALLSLVAAQVASRGGFEPAGRTANAWTETQEKGFQYLLQQQKDGVFFIDVGGGKRFPEPGLTGLALAALQTKPPAVRTEAESKTIASGLAWLLDQQNDKEGYFGQQNLNYTTCAAVMALAAAHDPAYQPALKKAQRYLLFLQATEDRGFGRSDRDYGSVGYGDDERGDLSNTQFALQALRDTGLDEQNEALQKALVFLARTQNLSKYNDFKKRIRNEDDGSWRNVEPGNDGGAVYYPGNSPAGYIELADGTRIPRSYGSMTYALLKAYILCGLKGNDPRVQAAVSWIKDHWTLESNPGSDPKRGEKIAYQGLYYYYLAMAQSLSLAGIDSLGDGDSAIDWRQQLGKHLTEAQRSDGSWLNTKNGRWWENRPLVCTIYAMLALSRCHR